MIGFVIAIAAALFLGSDSGGGDDSPTVPASPAPVAEAPAAEGDEDSSGNSADSGSPVAPRDPRPVAQASSRSVDAYVLAQRTNDGRVEFRLETEDGTVLSPLRHRLPGESNVDQWFGMSNVRLDGESLGRIIARMLADGQIEMGFMPWGGENILPESRLMAADATVGEWMKSSLISIPVPEWQTLIANSGPDGMGPDGSVPHLRECNFDDYWVASETRWPDFTPVDIVEVGDGKCRGWMKVDIGGELTWVHEHFLIRRMSDRDGELYYDIANENPLNREFTLAVVTDTEDNVHWFFALVNKTETDDYDESQKLDDWHAIWNDGGTPIRRGPPDSTGSYLSDYYKTNAFGKVVSVGHATIDVPSQSLSPPLGLNGARWWNLWDRYQLSEGSYIERYEVPVPFSSILAMQ